jgi:hypothetical protein
MQVIPFAALVLVTHIGIPFEYTEISRHFFIGLSISRCFTTYVTANPSPNGYNR